MGLEKRALIDRTTEGYGINRLLSADKERGLFIKEACDAG